MLGVFIWVLPALVVWVVVDNKMGKMQQQIDELRNQGDLVASVINEMKERN
ncbi:hypothetical protein [Dethiobacter alkaliphilus]|uniref:hypothetical protein n=1 Tax=Dethiobacter alkaliphilus TaxID=427926 RepID=UPI0022272B48|nr:hypothetical protein [Dethiobacter alkaliphilus]MCW3489226.1 hypothetical protein [Dethiobacter alkaliphilus]